MSEVIRYNMTFSIQFLLSCKYKYNIVKSTNLWLKNQNALQNKGIYLGTVYKMIKFLLGTVSKKEVRV